MAGRSPDSAGKVKGGVSMIERLAPKQIPAPGLKNSLTACIGTGANEASSEYQEDT